MNVPLPQVGHTAIDRQIECFAADIHRPMTGRDQAQQRGVRVFGEKSAETAVAASARTSREHAHV